MAFGKRGTSPAPQAAARVVQAAHARSQADPAPSQHKTALSAQQRETLVDELSELARRGAPESEKIHGTVSGRIVNEHGENANPTLTQREGVVSASEARRSDYYASSALGNLSAIIGVVGGVAAGLSPRAAVGFMLIVWGLSAVATGRMMQTRAFSERVYMGRAARLAGLAVMITGAWFIANGWSEPPALSHFITDYEAPVRNLFGRE